jgi:hypothetical protein
MISAGKAMAFGITVFVMLIVSVASIGILPRLSGFTGALPGTDAMRAGGNSSSTSGLAAMASKNKEMTETVKKQLNQEAREMIDKCLEVGGKCQEIGLLKEVCGSSSILKLESCSDPRAMELLRAAN